MSEHFLIRTRIADIQIGIRINRSRSTDIGPAALNNLRHIAGDLHANVVGVHMGQGAVVRVVGIRIVQVAVTHCSRAD